MRNEQCAGGMNCEKQEANFVTVQNFYCGPFSSISTLLSFWFMIFNVEFDSNSSCLDRLNNLDINSLQKLQN